MNCQNCNAPIILALERCEHCGAKLLHRRSYFGAERAQDFKLSAEENPIELTEPVEPVNDPEWQFPAEPASTSLPKPPEPLNKPQVEVEWGGFFRRLSAFSLDMTCISMLTSLMSSLAYLGYRVGLAAYGRAVNEDTVAPLAAILLLGWLVLTSAYFVVFHSGGGRTPGKTFMKLRVVSEGQGAVTRRQAVVRWLSLVGFAPFLLGWLWILVSREKRGWHDYLAHTWVIRDR